MAHFDFRGVGAVIAAFAGAIILLPPTAWGDDLLRWKFAAGDKFTLTTAQAQIVQGTAGEVKIVSRSQTLLSTKWSVEEVEADGTARIAVTFERLAIELSGAPPVKFDTDSKEPPAENAKELDAAVRPLVGVRVDVRLSPRGEFVSVKAPAATESALRRAAVLGRLGSLFTVDGTTRLWRQVLPVLPEKPVAIGGAWEDSYTSATPMGVMKTALSLKYAGPKKDAGEGIVEFGIAPKLTFADGSLESVVKTLEMGEKVEATTKIVKHEAKGRAEFDLANGRPVLTEIEQTFAIETSRGTQKIRTELGTATRMVCREEASGK